ncbi:MAG: ProQ/FINO family protein [Thiolinea sp.]
MTDTPRKTLSLKKKRIIKRADIPAAKLAKAGKKAPPKPAQKAKQPQKPTPKKPEVSPSELRARELYSRLNEFEVWRTYQPLAIGIDKAIFKICNDEQFAGASKNVVNKVLSRHTRRDVYQTNLSRGGQRYHLDGQPVGAITEQQQSIAKKQLIS